MGVRGRRSPPASDQFVAALNRYVPSSCRSR
jgi:hypothetical protein